MDFYKKITSPSKERLTYLWVLSFVSYCFIKTLWFYELGTIEEVLSFSWFSLLCGITIGLIIGKVAAA